MRTKPAIARALVPALALIVLAAGGWSAWTLTHRGTAVVAVDRASLVTDTVRRGVFVRSVRAPGLFVPDHVRVVAAASDGTVVSVPVRAGSAVSAGTVVAVLENPDLDAAVADATAQRDAAAAELQSSVAEAAASQLDVSAGVRSAAADAEQAAELAASNKKLYDQGLIGALQYRIAEIKARQARDLLEISRRRIAVDSAHTAAKIAAARAKVAQLSEQLDASRSRLAKLVAHAGVAGIVQTVSVNPGQRLTAAAQVAQIAARDDLKAVLQIPEADSHGIAPGMRATIDVPGLGTIRGHVSRLEPTAQNGTIGIDVALDRIPEGARPQQNVDGTIELARVPNAVFVARPANAADNAALDLYRLVDNGARAVRVPVRLGSGSLDRVQVLSGLAPGDTVIVSDTSFAHGEPVLAIQ